jgi:hypothetical protein
MPNVHKPPDGRKFDTLRALRGTFTKRLASMLRHNCEAPGLCWPIYTHLGALEAEEGGDGEGRRPASVLPSPYLEPEPLHDLQDQIFGFSDAARTRGRVWFTRATTLYDYALVLRSIADHVQRDGADTIRIVPWFDPVLQKTLPCSAAQLYGLTFYVEDVSTAAVFLDGRPVESLVRNPPDETGRPSVMIAECEIRHVLFEQLDPTLNAPQAVEFSGARWQWKQAPSDDIAHGRLTSEPTGGITGLATMRLPLFGLRPVGTQLIRFTVRAAPDASFAILLETETGGRFFFGDDRLLASIGVPLTAHYALSRHGRAADHWAVYVVPFHDLVWAPGTKPSGPMPNHPLTAVTLLCARGAGVGVDFADIALLRARATGLSGRPEPLFCLGGFVPSFVSGQEVHVAPANDLSHGGSSETVDQRGFFCFSGLPRGIYRVWSDRGVTRLVDRRGPLVEVNANVAQLVLDRQVEPNA